MLSGFILAHAYLGSGEAGRFRPGGFLARRLARLYPLHLVMLGTFLLLATVYGALGLTPFNRHQFAPNGLVPSLLLVQAWGVIGHFAFNSPSWSISAEWFAYLLFPAMATVLVRTETSGARLTALALALFFAMSLACYEATGEGIIGLTYDFGIVRVVPEFLLGVGLRRLAGERPLTRGASLALFRGSLVALLAFQVWRVWDPFPVPVFAGLILSTAELSRHRVRTVLDRPPLVHLGEVSYALYMVHLLVVVVIAHAARWALGGALPVAAQLVLFPAVILTALAAAELGLPQGRAAGPHARGAELQGVARPARVRPQHPERDARACTVTERPPAARNARTARAGGERRRRVGLARRDSPGR